MEKIVIIIERERALFVEVNNSMLCIFRFLYVKNHQKYI